MLFCHSTTSTDQYFHCLVIMLWLSSVLKRNNPFHIGILTHHFLSLISDFVEQKCCYSRHFHVTGVTGAAWTAIHHLHWSPGHFPLSRTKTNIDSSVVFDSELRHPHKMLSSWMSINEIWDGDQIGMPQLWKCLNSNCIRSAMCFSDFIHHWQQLETLFKWDLLKCTGVLHICLHWLDFIDVFQCCTNWKAKFHVTVCADSNDVIWQNV